MESYPYKSYYEVQYRQTLGEGIFGGFKFSGTWSREVGELISAGRRTVTPSMSTFEQSNRRKILNHAALREWNLYFCVYFTDAIFLVQWHKCNIGTWRRVNICPSPRRVTHKVLKCRRVMLLSSGATALQGFGRQSCRRRSAKLVGCHVVSATDPHGR